MAKLYFGQILLGNLALKAEDEYIWTRVETWFESRQVLVNDSHPTPTDNTAAFVAKLTGTLLKLLLIGNLAVTAQDPQLRPRPACLPAGTSV